MKTFRCRMTLAGLLLALATPSGLWASSPTLLPADFFRVLPMHRAASPATLRPPARFGVLATSPATDVPDASADPEDHRRYVLPVLLSAVVPGAGEIATGHFWRGLPLVAADVATWLVHANYEQKGRDWRDKYEAFADAHWH
jgi:hypothetical protein